MGFGIKRALKKIAKIILILSGSVLSLFVLIFLILSVPVVQTAAGHKAAAYLSRKTGASISIDQLHFTATGKISLSSVLIMDRKSDTILYAGKIITGIHPAELLDKNIHLRSTTLELIRAKISRSSRDSLYNFSFIVNAFSGKGTDTSSGKNSFVFHPGDLSIHDLKCSYIDSLSGIFSNTSLSSLSLSPKKFDLNNMFFSLREFKANGLNGNLLITKNSGSNGNEEHSHPLLRCDNISVSNSGFIYADSTQKTIFRFLSGELAVKKLMMAPGKIFFSADKFDFENGGFWYSYAQQNDTVHKKTVEKNEESWMLKVAAINLKNDQVHINNVKKLLQKNQFDAEHLDLSALNVQTKNSVFSDKEINADIAAISGKTEDDFEIRNGSGFFRMHGNTISTKELAIKTGYSSFRLNSDFTIPENDSAIIDAKGALNAEQIYTRDILYFAPQLSHQPFFFYADNYSKVKANFVTKNKDLLIQAFDLVTGKQSKIKMNGHIRNFQQPALAFYDIKKLEILSSANDIHKMQLDKFFPPSIHLPDSIYITSVFQGQIKNFSTESSLKSSLGNADIKGKLDKNENFSGTLNLERLNLPVLLGSPDLPGPVTLTATAKGQGLDTNSFQMDLQASAPSIEFNHYSWRNIAANGHISYRQYSGEIRLNDPNAEIIAKGEINLAKGKEEYKLAADVKGADLEKLKLSNADYKVAFSASADLKGSDMNDVNGNAGVTGLIISHNDKKYFLDSLLFAAVNETGKSELTLRSPVVNINYSGSFAPGDLAKEMKQYINSYFKAFDMKGDSTLSKQSFELSIKMHNHPVLSEVIFPKLKTFEPGNITGKFDGANRKLEFNLDLPRLEYDNISINKLQCVINGDNSQLKYKLNAFNLSSSNLSFENFQVAGNIQDQKIVTNISSVDDNKNKKLLLNTSFTNEKEGKRFSVDPAELVIMSNKWNVSADNFILFRKNEFLIHKMDFSSGSGTIAVESANDRMNDDIRIDIRDFNPLVFSNVIRKDSAWLEGNINGKILLKRQEKNYGIVANATVDSLKVHRVSIGNLELKGNENTQGYDISLVLKGPENNVSIKGDYSVQQDASTLRLSSEIGKLSVRTLEALFPKEVKETDGNISGNISVSGQIKNPVLNGTLNFDNVYFRPEATNSRLSITNQNLQVKDNTLIFQSFTMKDASDHEAVISGNISMKDDVPTFGLNMHTNDFLILNTARDAKKEFYGRLVADSRIAVKGNLNSPVITSSVKVKNQSNFTFAVPEERMSADRGEDVIIFEDSLKLNKILRRNDSKNQNKSDIRNLNILSTIEIDRKATLRLLIDPISHDSLVMKGEGALSFALDPGGKVSLTGLYNINEGNYLASLENLIKRSFVIESGSSVIWNGDPLDALININAHHIVRTSPIDLVAGQLSPAESAEFRRRQAFQIDLKLRGALLSPQVSFEVHMAQGERGEGAAIVNARLEQLNDDPSSLNKQVFSLLVLGRFTQENPLQTETNSSENAARATVGKFLSSQLNQLSSKLIPGVDVNFDVQSYEDYSNGRNEGRTQVGVGVSKQLFNERLSVQVGGAVDVEGPAAAQNNASDIAGDVTVQYKMSQDGTYRLKGFRTNQYEGLIEGQIIETGAGIIYVKDFDRWKNLFRKKTPVFDNNEHALSDK
jgi:hypothetical protein